MKRNQRQNSVTLKYEPSADLECYFVERKLIWSFTLLHTLVTGSSVTYFNPCQHLYFGLSFADDFGVTATFVNLFHHETMCVGALG